MLNGLKPKANWNHTTHEGPSYDIYTYVSKSYICFHFWQLYFINWYNSMNNIAKYTGVSKQRAILQWSLLKKLLRIQADRIIYLTDNSSDDAGGKVYNSSDDAGGKVCLGGW